MRTMLTILSFLGLLAVGGCFEKTIHEARVPISSPNKPVMAPLPQSAARV